MDELPRDEAGAPYVPLMPDRADYKAGEILTLTERSQRKEVREDLIARKLPHTLQDIKREIERLNDIQRSSGKRVPGLALVPLGMLPR